MLVASDESVEASKVIGPPRVSDEGAAFQRAVSSLRRSQVQEPSHLCGLVVGVEIEVDALGDPPSPGPWR